MAEVQAVLHVAGLRAQHHHFPGNIAFVVSDDDEDLDVFYFRSSSLETDDGVDVLKPDDLLVTQQGRWHRKKFAAEDIEGDLGGGEDETAYHSGDALCEPATDTGQDIGSVSKRVNNFIGRAHLVYDAADDDYPSANLSTRTLSLGRGGGTDYDLIITASSENVAEMSPGQVLRCGTVPDDDDDLANKKYVDDAIEGFSEIPLTTKGDLLTHDGDDPVRLAVDAIDGHVLISDSTADEGLSWSGIVASSLELVETKVLSSDSDEFTFDSTLDGDEDGNYVISGTLISGTNTTCNYYLRPNNIADTNMRSTGLLVTTADSVVGAHWDAMFVGVGHTLNTQCTIDVEFHARSGFKRGGWSKCMRSIGNLDQGHQVIMAWNDSATQVTSLRLHATGSTGVGFKAGSVLSLWRKLY